MHHAFYALVRHDDVEKFELEDGLVRHAGKALLAEPSSLKQVALDIRRAATDALGLGIGPTKFEASIRLTASEEFDVRPAALPELVADVARIVGAFTITTHELADLGTSWLGTATPGTKLSYFLECSPGIDRSDHDRWIDDAMQSCLERMDGVAVRHHRPISELSPGIAFDTIAEFTFPTEASLLSAAETHALTPLIGSELLDSASTRVLASVEHRLVPNQNAWDIRDGTPSEK